MASAPVYAVLLHQPQWYGVPLKIVMWNFMGTTGCLLLTLLLMPTVWLKLLGSLVVLCAAIGLHVAFQRWGHTDPDLLEIVLRFAITPRYLGPR